MYGRGLQSGAAPVVEQGTASSSISGSGSSSSSSSSSGCQVLPIAYDRMVVNLVMNYVVRDREDECPRRRDADRTQKWPLPPAIILILQPLP